MTRRSPVFLLLSAGLVVFAACGYDGRGLLRAENEGGEGGGAGTGGALGGGAGVAGGGAAGAPLAFAKGERLVAGQAHACVLRDGALACWGHGAFGALANGTTDDARTLIASNDSRRWSDLCLGGQFGCARSTTGAVACWGRNDNGQLGLGNTIDTATPTEIPALADATALGCGYGHACAVRRDGSLWCWGSNLFGALGFPNDEAKQSLVPRRVGTRNDWRTMTGGLYHSCALTSDGELWCWGDDSAGQCGSGTAQPTPIGLTRVGQAVGWSAIEAGQQATCALRGAGELWCWGANGEGALGLANRDIVAVPTRLAADRAWVEVQVDTFTGCARDAAGALLCWGRNAEGQLGLGAASDVQLPTAIPLAAPIAEIAVGRFFHCVRTAAGVVSCAGANDAGQLANGGTERAATLTPIVGP
jgi:alpha-tubulin suppressor-like RCC1 family protein